MTKATPDMAMQSTGKRRFRQLPAAGDRSGS